MSYTWQSKNGSFVKLALSSKSTLHLHLPRTQTDLFKAQMPTWVQFSTDAETNPVRIPKGKFGAHLYIIFCSNISSGNALLLVCTCWGLGRPCSHFIFIRFRNSQYPNLSESSDQFVARKVFDESSEPDLVAWPVGLCMLWHVGACPE